MVSYLSRSKDMNSYRFEYLFLAPTPSGNPDSTVSIHAFLAETDKAAGEEVERFTADVTDNCRIKFVNLWRMVEGKQDGLVADQGAKRCAYRLDFHILPRFPTDDRGAGTTVSSHTFKAETDKAAGEEARRFLDDFNRSFDTKFVNLWRMVK